MTKLVQGAYIILSVGNKSELAKCTFADGDTFKAVLERDKEKDEKSPPVVKFERSDVMAVLGKRPKNGSVYGQKIEPLVRRLDVPYWGSVRLYNFFEDHQIKMLKDELKVAAEHLKKLRVTGMFKAEVEVRQPQGKYAGYYKYRPKAETDILCVKPENTFEGFSYIVFHEYAHGMWYRGMTAKMRFAWVKLYHEYVTLQEIEEKELEDILGEIESAESIRAFQAEADDESKLVLKKVLKHINEVHGLNVKHLEMALENGDSIKEYWPSFIEMSETEACITDYARKSPEEFFAEAIAHKFEGRKLPKKVESLYEITMARLVKGGGAEVKREKKEEEVKKKKKKISDEEVDVDGGNKLKKKKKKRMDGLK
jgi:hypothetical protein